MVLSRTAMYRDSAPCSHSANGQTADRHPVCPSAVWPFFYAGSRRGGQNPGEGGMACAFLRSGVQ